MRAAFYAPMKPPGHAVPSGDRSIARLFMAALEGAGYRPQVASTLRTWTADPAGHGPLHARAVAEAARLAAKWQSDPPDLWFTYHVYYKAPDWIGPAVCRALGLPYVIAEASYAPKRAGGPWSTGHTAAGESIRDADLILSPTRLDMNCIANLLHNKKRNVFFPPFLDHRPFAEAAAARADHRAAVAQRFGLDPEQPWILTVAMMRNDAKRDSYEVIARMLPELPDDDWQYLVVGDGPAAPAIRQALSPWQDRIRFAGAVAPEELPALYAASDLYLWPAVDEAFGMAFLEAQAAGLPVVAGNERGVPDVVLDGATALLAPPHNHRSLAAMTNRLLVDPALRATMARQAATFVAGQRSLDGAAGNLAELLATLPRAAR